ncbi:YybH family protein [Acinetobacter larvae]|nr:nuclear transport factor 2 family protein [Acinetobacter larvae]
MIDIKGNQHIAADVIRQIEYLDHAVVNKQVDSLMQQYDEQVCLFDLASHIDGVEDYREEWEKFCFCFRDKVRIVRRDMKLYVSDDIAVLHCYSKIENIDDHSAMMPWCRTTMCLQLQKAHWRVIHQHISLPMQLNSSSKAKADENLQKLDMVV